MMHYNFVYYILFWLTGFLFFSCHIVENMVFQEQKIVDPIMDLYNSQDVNVLRDAIKYVAEKKDKNAITPLNQLVYKSDNLLSLRIMAAEAMVDIQKEQSLFIIKRLLIVSDSALLQAGLAMLNRLLEYHASTELKSHYPELGGLLLQVIQTNTSFPIKNQAIQLIGDLDYKEAFDDLFYLVSSEKSIYKSSAIFPLVRLCTPEQLEKVRSIILDVLENYYDSYHEKKPTTAVSITPEMLVQFRMALYAMDYGESYNPEYLKYVSQLGLHNVPIVLQSEQVMLSNAQKSKSYLNKALNDVDSIIRIRAARLLQTIGDNESIKIMMDEIQKVTHKVAFKQQGEASCPDYIPTFIRSVGMLKGEALLKEVKTLLEHPKTRNVTLEALMNYSPLDVELFNVHFQKVENLATINTIIAKQFNANQIEWMQQQIQSPNRWIRLGILVYLKRIGFTKSSSVIQQWIDTEADAEIKEALSIVFNN